MHMDYILNYIIVLRLNFFGVRMTLWLCKRVSFCLETNAELFLGEES